MATQWIKWTKGLTRKREVVAISSALGIGRHETAARLMEVWEWADDNTIGCHVPSVTETFIDEVAGVTGFANSMVSIGWLSVSEDGLTFPNFERHNGETAKSRALASERKRKQRESVATKSRTKRDKIATREEKRREDTPPIVPQGTSEDESSKSKRKRFVPPTIDAVSAYCNERKNGIDPQAFRDYYDARGWKLASNVPMRDWRAAIRTWEARRRNETKPQTSGPAQAAGDYAG